MSSDHPDYRQEPEAVSDKRESWEDVQEEAAWILRGYLAVIFGPILATRPGPLRDPRYVRRASDRAEAEHRDRAEWLTDVKQRLGLVTMNERKQ